MGQKNSRGDYETFLEEESQKQTKKKKEKEKEKEKEKQNEKQNEKEKEKQKEKNKKNQEAKNLQEKSKQIPRERRTSKDKNKKPQTTPEVLVPTVFRWKGGGNNVKIKASFTNWEPIKMSQSESDFTLILNLPVGQHKYVYVVDGETAISYHEPITMDENGEMLNITEIKTIDEEMLSPNNSLKKSSPREYSQHVPPILSYQTYPPKIPPLLHHPPITLDTGDDPSHMSIPSHVILNHLYSITREDVVIYSSTNRYKSKFVTTVLYKPI
ncbi:snf1-related protein kinase regulatory subunit beta-1 [Anaeramoeba ignava]|uniref:Snf1-related protein kinase regulatory subunit beta-1 n=1 Tax=Anaeramoeba ignava TaxID=1746090 RepID=A0A9Q0LJF1_ANAIG|nr:snf1-related protein kinase regulatory subunit beta-1 [Anaeramoeba ignava]